MAVLGLACFRGHFGQIGLGLTGKTTLNTQRDATKPAVIITVKDGKFKYVETISP
jgi:hypothetical protein